jgi:hypothetical protein
MKSSSMTMIFGIVMILWGLSIILKAFFDIDIPIIKPAIALLLIYIGISLITKPKMTVHCFTDVEEWNESCDCHSQANKENTHNFVFSSGTLDLNQLPPDLAKPAHLSLNVVFGSGQLVLNPQIPTTLCIKSAFGQTTLPDKSTAVFGSQMYYSQPGKEPQLHIHAQVVFGNLTVTSVKAA